MEISKRDTPVHLVAITGGLAFLHALSDRTLSLRLTDRSSDVTHYVRSMLALLFLCEDRASFFGVLTGRRLIDTPTGESTFVAEPFSARDDILSRLAPETRSAIAEWYPLDGFDITTATTTSRFDSISFLYSHFRFEVCNWLIGYGCFATEESYTVMRSAVIRLQPTFTILPLEDFPFSECPKDTLVLASNTDSPLFTHNDAVLRSIESSGNRSVFYISRTRDASMPWEPKRTLPTFPDSSRFLAIGCDLIAPADLTKQFGGKWINVPYADYCKDLYYDHDCLIINIPDPAPPDASEQIRKGTSEDIGEDASDADGPSSELVIRQISEDLPIHQSIVVISSRSELLRHIAATMSRSYAMSAHVLKALPTTTALFCELKFGSRKIGIQNPAK